MSERETWSLIRIRTWFLFFSFAASLFLWFFFFFGFFYRSFFFFLFLIFFLISLNNRLWNWYLLLIYLIQYFWSSSFNTLRAYNFEFIQNLRAITSENSLESFLIIDAIYNIFDLYFIRFDTFVIFFFA